MKRLESTKQGSTREREMTVFNNTKEELYSVLLSATAGSAQTTVKLFEGVGEERLGDGTAAWKALEA